MLTRKDLKISTCGLSFSREERGSGALFGGSSCGGTGVTACRRLEGAAVDGACDTCD
jgi:hypothetical protein